MKCVTTEGHRFEIVPGPQGLGLFVATKHRDPDPNAKDVYQLGISFKNLVRALSELDSPGGFRGDAGDCSMRREGGRIALRFVYQHSPEKAFETWLSEADSEVLKAALESRLVGGGDYDQGVRLAVPAPKIGRNDACPCGSGKKFKKCCGSQQAKETVGSDLTPFHGVDNEVVRSMLEAARRHPVFLKDAGFWSDLGTTLGTMSEFSLALNAQTRSIQLAPTDLALKANYAATLDAMGRSQEALDLLRQLPDADGKFAVLIANALFQLGRPMEAVPHYERAIQFEPGFAHAYTKLLAALTSTQSPLYEHWIERARRQFPTSPAIALHYARMLLRENRLEELAEGDWVGRLENVPDQRVIGLNREEPQFIVEIELLRHMAWGVLENDPEHLKFAQRILCSSPAEWQMCHCARQLCIVARDMGQREVVSKASARLCNKCLSNARSSDLVPVWLAQASYFARDWTGTIRDAEAGLSAHPDVLEFLPVYWWALDEVGRSGEALDVARRLHTAIPDHIFLTYNMGYLAGKLGQFAAATRYYEEELRHRCDSYLAMENLALLRLTEGDTTSAAALMLRWQANALEHLDPGLIASKVEKHRLLEQFVAQNQGSLSLALDVTRLNEQSEPFLGAVVKVSRDRPTREQLVQMLVEGDLIHQQEAIYAFQREQRGDHSALMCGLEEAFPRIRSLPDPAIRTLIEAQAQLDEATRADFAPCCMAFCKGVEIALFTMTFRSFRDHIQNSPGLEGMLAQASSPGFEKAGSIVKFLSKGTPIELGGMAFIFTLCQGKTGQSMQMLRHFREWLASRSFGSLLEPGVVESLADLAKSYRNPASHSTNYDRKTGLEVRRVCLWLLNRIFQGSPAKDAGHM